jgi:protein-arginine kinase activator protein McsA
MVLGEPKGDFGLRLCQRVQCSKCQKFDYVAKLISKARQVLCRSCAESELAVFDRGRVIAASKVSRSCTKCLKSFEVNEDIAAKKNELMCRDCYRGFDIWRGKAGVPGSRNKSFVIKNGSNIIIRKLCP